MQQLAHKPAAIALCLLVCAVLITAESARPAQSVDDARIGILMPERHSSDMLAARAAGQEIDPEPSEAVLGAAGKHDQAAPGTLAQRHETQALTRSVELLLLPRNATADLQRIWHYRDGAWHGLTPPVAERNWRAIVANPFAPSQWLLLAESTTVPMPGDMLWYTADAGASWSPVALTGITNTYQLYSAAIEWSDTNPGHWAIAGRSFDMAAPRIWRGSGAEERATLDLPGLRWVMWASGLDGDFVTIVDNDLAYIDTADVVHVPPGSTDGYSWVHGMDRLPGASPAIVAIPKSGSLYASEDYRTTQPEERVSLLLRSPAATTHGIYVGSQDGIIRVTDIFSQPVTTVVTGSGMGFNVVRADHQTRTAVAALLQFRSAVYLLADEGQEWERIEAPSPSIANYLEVIVRLQPSAPIAAAGSDQTVVSGADVTLDGSASSDPNGHLPLQFGWQQTAGPSVTLSSSSVMTPTFRAPDSPGLLSFSLVVTNSQGLASTMPDTVAISVTDRLDQRTFLPLLHYEEQP